MYKKIILVLALILPLLLTAATLSVELELKLQDTEINLQSLARQGYGCVSAAGAYQLPVKNVRVLLPAGAVVSSWNVNLSSPSAVSGQAPKRNAGFYNSETLLTATVRETSSTSVFLGLKRWGELQYAEFALLPASWDGLNWRWHSSARIELSFDQPKQGKGKVPPVFNQNDFFVNQSSLSDWYSQSKDRDTRVLVIGTQPYYNALTPWVNFRNSQGLTVSFTPIDSALAAGTGTNDAAKLRSYLQGQYTQNPFSYLLLLGDYNTVPVAYVTPEPDGVDTVPTDFFYGDLSSNWDSDNDERLGEYSTGNMDQDYEVDFTPEVYVGRLSTNSISNIGNIANRIVAYEQSAEAWKRKNLLPAAFLNYNGEPELPMAETDGGLFMEFLRNTALQGMDNFSLYEQEGVVPSFPSDLPLSYDNFRTKLTGESWGFINWSAHGSSASSSRKVWMVDTNQNNLPDDYEMEWQNLVNRQSFDNLSNQNGTVIFAASCYNGMIDADSNCLGEYALIKKAVGVLAATRTGWYKIGWANPGWGGLSSYNYHFVENFRQTHTTLGAAHAWANLLHTQYYLFGDPIDSGGIIWPELQNVYTYLLFGDPLVGYNTVPAVPQGEILVWEPEGNEGLAVVNAIREITDMNVIYSDKLIVDYDYLNSFEAVFCLMGQGTNTFNLDPQSYQYAYLNNYLNSGGRLYLEGGYSWAGPTDVFWDKFGAFNPFDGFTMISDIRHPLSNFVWSYGLPTDPVVMLTTVSDTATPLFINDLGEGSGPIIAIRNTNGNYRSIASTFNLAAVQNTGHSLAEMVGIILDTLGVTSYQPVANDDPGQVPVIPQLTLYPNPSSSTLNIKYELGRPEPIDLEIYNLKGQKVYNHSEQGKTGTQNLVWNLLDNRGNRVGSGIYFCQLRQGKTRLTRKLIVIR